MKGFRLTLLLCSCCRFSHRTCNNAHILVLQFNESPSYLQQDSSLRWSFSKLTVIGGEKQMDGSWKGGCVKRQQESFDTPEEAQQARTAAADGSFMWECSVDEFLACAPSVQAAATMFQPAEVTFQQQGKSFETRVLDALGATYPTTQLFELRKLFTAESLAIVARKLGGWIAGGTIKVDENADCAHISDSAVRHVIASYEMRGDNKRVPHSLLSDSIEVRQALLGGQWMHSRCLLLLIDSFVRCSYFAVLFPLHVQA